MNEERARAGSVGGSRRLNTVDSAVKASTRAQDFTKGTLLRVGGENEVFRFHLKLQNGDLAVIGSRGSRYFRPHKVGPLCGPCTTKDDQDQRIPGTCRHCQALKDRGA